MRPLLILSLLPLSVSAAIFPIPQQYDYRITTSQYNPENVINVRTKVGVSTLIQLGDDEFISTPADGAVSASPSGMGIGDASAWGMSVNGNNIFLKPIGEFPDTNLTVVSNKGRTYSFWLELSDFPHFIVKMVYEKPKTANALKSNVPCYDGVVNFDYEMWGDKELAPQYMWDDGRFTCLKFEDNKELPVAYQVGSDGQESLINYHLEQDVMVLQGTSNELRLRLGESVLGLASSAIQTEGYNDKATSVDAKRVVKDE